MASTIKAELRLLSSLAKVFPDAVPDDPGAAAGLHALRGETVSFQAAYCQTGGGRGWGRMDIVSPIASLLTARRVALIPGTVPQAFGTDTGYLSTAPGLFPDLLMPADLAKLPLTPGHWQSIWLDVRVPEDFAPGEYPVRVMLSDMSGEIICTADTQLSVSPARLPEQTLPHTEWFHADCLAQYYGVPVFSDRHWEIVERFVSCAAEHGVNMLLTPIHTPPLDTAIGGERETVQLLDIIDDGNGQYRFGFDKLRRWVEMARRAGIKTLEIAHLFTQWGAKHAPKIMGMRGGVETRLFGWDTDATGDQYVAYLRQMLPALVAFLREIGMYENTVFHLSDEPGAHDLDAYRAAKAVILPLLPGARIADAISDIDFYRSGLVETPICATNHIGPFLDADVQDLWCYYCCGQSVNVSNRFLTQPLNRLRVLGTQMYKYDIKGFLHWGFNFYNSMHSVYPINPFYITDGDGAFPSGDPFIVYPGPGGEPLGSVRLMALKQAFQDVAALRLLEQTVGRSAVIKLIDEDLSRPLTFDYCPEDPAYLLGLRQKVNGALAE